MFNKLKSLISRPDVSPVDPVSDPTLAPDRPFFAIGDVHGCADRLDEVLRQIDAERARPDMQDAAVVFMGDLVDRGPDSAKVLRQVRAMQQAAPDDVLCLTGNHEVMMLDFIDDPLGRGLRWLTFGGQETLSSFGIKPTSGKADAEDIMEVADQLEELLDQGQDTGLVGWIRDQPFLWQTGNIACVHAGLDPDLPLGEQREKTFAWGHRDFRHRMRDDGLWVVHGHTITRQPACEQGRIAVDTGAYKGGRLTAAAISTGACRFLQG